MFNKKTKLKLTNFEYNLLWGGMNEFHNMLLSNGIPTEDVDELLLKIPISMPFCKVFSVKNDLIEFLLQGRFFILVCLLCYKAVCLFTNITTPKSVSKCGLSGSETSDWYTER